MDPNETLKEIRELSAKILADVDRDTDPEDAARLAELNEALDEWILKGGFLPSAWQ